MEPDFDSLLLEALPHVLVATDADELCPTDVWHLSEVRTLDVFRSRLAEASQAPEEARGLSRVLESKRAEWFSEVGRSPRVHVSARRIGNQFRFVVKDNGIGIDMKYAERVFEMSELRKGTEIHFALPGAGGDEP